MSRLSSVDCPTEQMPNFTHNNAGAVTAFLLGLTTLQVGWEWLREHRQFNRLSLTLWLFGLALLTCYYLLLHVAA